MYGSPQPSPRQYYPSNSSNIGQPISAKDYAPVETRQSPYKQRRRIVLPSPALTNREGHASLTSFGSDADPRNFSVLSFNDANGYPQDVVTSFTSHRNTFVRDHDWYRPSPRSSIVNASATSQIPMSWIESPPLKPQDRAGEPEKITREASSPLKSRTSSGGLKQGKSSPSLGPVDYPLPPEIAIHTGSGRNLRASSPTSRQSTASQQSSITNQSREYAFPPAKSDTPRSGTRKAHTESQTTPRSDIHTITSLRTEPQTTTITTPRSDIHTITTPRSNVRTLTTPRSIHEPRRASQPATMGGTPTVKPTNPNTPQSGPTTTQDAMPLGSVPTPVPESTALPPGITPSRPEGQTSIPNISLAVPKPVNKTFPQSFEGSMSSDEYTTTFNTSVSTYTESFAPFGSSPPGKPPRPPAGVPILNLERAHSLGHGSETSTPRRDGSEPIVTPRSDPCRDASEPVVTPRSDILKETLSAETGKDHLKEDPKSTSNGEAMVAAQAPPSVISSPNTPDQDEVSDATPPKDPAHLALGKDTILDDTPEKDQQVDSTPSWPLCSPSGHHRGRSPSEHDKGHRPHSNSERLRRSHERSRVADQTGNPCIKIVTPTPRAPDNMPSCLLLKEASEADDPSSVSSSTKGTSFNENQSFPSTESAANTLSISSTKGTSFGSAQANTLSIDSSRGASFGQSFHTIDTEERIHSSGSGLDSIGSLLGKSIDTTDVNNINASTNNQSVNFSSASLHFDDPSSFVGMSSSMALRNVLSPHSSPRTSPSRSKSITLSPHRTPNGSTISKSDSDADTSDTSSVSPSGHNLRRRKSALKKHTSSPSLKKVVSFHAPAKEPSQAADASFTRGENSFGMTVVSEITGPESYINLSASAESAPGDLQDGLYIRAPICAMEKMMEKDTIWYCIAKRDLAGIKALVEDSGISILTDPGFEETYSLGPWFSAITFGTSYNDFCISLMHAYPEIITYTTLHGPYEGQNSLHLAVMTRNMKLATALVEREPKLLEGKATGPFFQLGKPCGYGAFPLWFAMCTDQYEMANYFLENGADLWGMQDDGNTLLHVAVYMDDSALYDIVKEKIEERGSPPEKWQSCSKFDNVSPVNNDGLTPLNLAVSLGNLPMFIHILKVGCEILWRYDKILCRLYPLEGVDRTAITKVDSFIRRNGEPIHIKCTLEVIIETGIQDFFPINFITQLIERKWDQGVRRYFHLRFLVTAMVLLLLVRVVIARTMIEWRLLLLITTGKLYVEMKELYDQGPAEYFTGGGNKVNMWENINALLFCGCIFLSEALDLIGWEDYEMLFLSLSILCYASYFLFLFLGFELTGPLVIVVVMMVSSDLVRFLLLYGITLIGFASAIKVLKPDDAIWDCLFQGVMATLGEPEFTFAENSISPQLVALLIFFWVVFSAVLLVNLLIAMMGSTYTNIIDQAHGTWMLSRLKLIMVLEQDMPIWMQKEHYWVAKNDRIYLPNEEEGDEAFTALAYWIEEKEVDMM